jgi:2'-5' RNA ligase
MNHFLGFFIDDQTKRSVVGTVGRISNIFSDMSIEVRWIKPSNYHIKLQNLGGNVGLIKKLYISKKLKDALKLPIKTSIGNVKVGNSRNLKGLIYLELGEGGDELREMRYEMLNTLKIKDNVQFVPHIAIGRINKDLSRQEYSNILKDIDNISEGLSDKRVSFSIDEIDLVRVEDTDYEILKKFTASS